MKFRTEIEIAPLGTKIGYENRILALGSCFAEHIAGRLAQAKFRVTANPSGILFNPLSIAAALRSYAGEKPVRHSELGFDGELWFHYGFHGSFSAPEADQALAAMNAARKSGAEALRAADRIVLTFGTARAKRSPTATAGPPRSSRGAGWAWTRSSQLSQTSWQVRSAAGR